MVVENAELDVLAGAVSVLDELVLGSELLAKLGWWLLLQVAVVLLLVRVEVWWRRS